MVSRRNYLQAVVSGSSMVLAGCLDSPLFPDEGTPTNNSTSTTSPPKTPTDTETPTVSLEYVVSNITGTITDFKSKHPIIGSPDADIFIHYFNDADCPFCEKWEKETLPKLYKEYVEPGDVSIFWRPVGFSFKTADFFATAVYEMVEYSVDSDTAIPQGQFLEWWFNVVQNLSENPRGYENSEYLQSSLINAGFSRTTAKAITENTNEYNSYPAQIVKDNASLANLYDATGTPSFIVVEAGLPVINSGISVYGAQPIEAFEQAFKNAKKRTNKG